MNANPNDDFSLLFMRTCQGNRKAIEQFYTILPTVVYDYLASLESSMDHHKRQDLVQEVLLRIWIGIVHFRGEASPKTFIFAIAKRVLHEEQSRRVKLPLVFPNNFDQIADTHVSDKLEAGNELEYLELAQIIEQAKAKLPNVERQALELKQIHDLSMKDLAKLAGCEYGQLRNRLYRARKCLKQLLKNYCSVCVLF